jgi:hypothetical protein
VAVCQAGAKVALRLSDVEGNLVTRGIYGSIRTWTQEGGFTETFAAHKAPVRGLVKIGKFVVTADWWQGQQAKGVGSGE